METTDEWLANPLIHGNSKPQTMTFIQMNETVLFPFLHTILDSLFLIKA